MLICEVQNLTSEQALLINMYPASEHASQWSPIGQKFGQKNPRKHSLH